MIYLDLNSSDTIKEDIIDKSNKKNISFEDKNTNIINSITEVHIQ